MFLKNCAHLTQQITAPALVSVAPFFSSLTAGVTSVIVTSSRSVHNSVDRPLQGNTWCPAGQARVAGVMMAFSLTSFLAENQHPVTAPGG